MPEAFICDATRTPVGRYGGGLAQVRTDDLAALPMRALLERNPELDPAPIDDVVFGCANQAGEDNRNVARMALLLAGLPAEVPGTTVNRLCGSGMDAVGIAARAIKAGEQDLIIAGGVESMSRAPFVMGKAAAAFSREAEIFDTTIGWRFVNPLMAEQYGVDSMPETAENVAEEFEISREDQDRFAAWSQAKPQRRWRAAASRKRSRRSPCRAASRSRSWSTRDEHPRPGTTLEKLAGLHAAVPQGRHGDGRQRLGRQRRRLRPAGGLRGRGEAARSDSRGPASWRWRPPACRRASWGSGRRRRPGSSWRGPA